MDSVMFDKIKGGIYGLLIGDALGVPYEFHSANEIPSFEKINYNPPKGYNRAHQGILPGTWSDDGAQALCLLKTLVDYPFGFNATYFADLMEKWYFEGFMALDNKVFDIGCATRESLEKYSVSKDIFGGSNTERSNGNGSLMRVLPLALIGCSSDASLLSDAMAQSIITHAHPRSMICCALYCFYARNILNNIDFPWAKAVHSVIEQYKKNEDSKALEEICTNIIPAFDNPPKGSGYVVDSLVAAISLQNYSSFEEVVKQAIILGDDTDTTAAIAGGIAGIRFGFSNIPPYLIEGLRGKEIVEELLSKIKM